MAARFVIGQALAAEDVEAVRGLFVRYEEEIGVALCFQGFDCELATLPGAYAPPAGNMLLARDETGLAVGCVALRPLADGAGELKRLYVTADGRGFGLGRRLAETAIAEARGIGYRRILLDTLPTMTTPSRTPRTPCPGRGSSSWSSRRWAGRRPAPLPPRSWRRRR